MSGRVGQDCYRRWVGKYPVKSPQPRFQSNHRYTPMPIINSLLGFEPARQINEPPNEKTNNLHRRKQRRRFCFRYTDSTVPLLLKSEISSFLPTSVIVQTDLCRTCSETTLLVFPQGGSYITSQKPTMLSTKLSRLMLNILFNCFSSTYPRF